jgi:hypothetical protein
VKRPKPSQIPDKHTAKLLFDSNGDWGTYCPHCGKWIYLETP